MKKEIKLALVGALASGFVYSAVPANAAYVGTVLDTYRNKYDRLAGKWVLFGYASTYKELRVPHGFSETGDSIYYTETHATWFANYHRKSYRVW